MAASGARKAPPSNAANTKATLVDPAAVDDAATEEDKKKITLKLKKPNPKQTKPGNWKDSDVEGSKKKSDTDAPSSPLVNQPDEKTSASFPTGRPVDDTVDLVQCKHCRRPVTRIEAPAHIKGCLNKKQEKLKKKKEAKEAKDAALRKEKGLDDDDDKSSKNARKTSAKVAAGTDDAKKGKKRKLEEGGEKGPNAKKKKKDEPKVKATKDRKPVDVEKQCGVLMPNGQMCARSLTCKSHSMGAKRAVPGRSMPYDVLLQNYQKRSRAEQQRAALDANGPNIDDLENHGPVDSDEERDAVMLAISRSRPQPLATRTLVSTKSKYQFIRMKEMLHNALGGRGGGLFSTAPPPQPANSNQQNQQSNQQHPTPIDTSAAQRMSFGTGAFASPLNSAGPLESAGLMGAFGDGGGSRRSSMAPQSAGGPRTMVPGGQFQPNNRKASIGSLAAGGV